MRLIHSNIPVPVLSNPFTFNPPRDTPLSLGSTCVYVKTGLDVPNALDPSDRDEIKSPPALSSRAFSTPPRTSTSVYIRWITSTASPRATCIPLFSSSSSGSLVAAKPGVSRS